MPASFNGSLSTTQHGTAANGRSTWSDMRQTPGHSFAHQQGWQCSGSQDEATSGTRAAENRTERKQKQSKIEPVSQLVGQRILSMADGPIGEEATQGPRFSRRELAASDWGNTEESSWPVCRSITCYTQPLWMLQASIWAMYVPAHQKLAATVHANLETASKKIPDCALYISCIGRQHVAASINLPKRRAYRV